MLNNIKENFLNKKKKGFLILVIILVIFLVIAFFFFINKQGLISEEKAAEMAEETFYAQAYIKQATQDCYDSDGYIKDNMIKTAIDKSKSALQEKISDYILDIQSTSDSMTVELRNNEKMVYIPPQKNCASGIGDLSIEVFEPYYTENEYKSKEYSGNLYNRNQKIAREESSRNLKLKYDENCYRDSDVSVEDLKNLFGTNQLILWEGHGGMANSEEDPTPVIMTGTKLLEGNENIEWRYILDTIQWPFDGNKDQKIRDAIKETTKNFHKYGNELIDGNLYIAYAADPSNYGEARFAFSPSFVKRFGSLQNSVFYLGCCHSLQNDDMANAFLEKGAAAVYGFTEEVTFKYANKIKPFLLKNLNEGQSYLCAAGKSLYDWEESTSIPEILDSIGKNIPSDALERFNYTDAEYFDLYRYYNMYPYMVSTKNIDNYIARLKCRSAENNHHSFECDDFIVDVKADQEKRWFVYSDYDNDYDCQCYLFDYSPISVWGDDTGSIDVVMVSDKPLNKVKGANRYPMYVGQTSKNKYVYLAHGQSTFIGIEGNSTNNETGKFNGIDREPISTSNDLIARLYLK